MPRLKDIMMVAKKIGMTSLYGAFSRCQMKLPSPLEPCLDFNSRLGSLVNKTLVFSVSVRTIEIFAPFHGPSLQTTEEAYTLVQQKVCIVAGWGK
jgi:hypothetical protein